MRFLPLLLVSLAVTACSGSSGAPVPGSEPSTARGPTEPPTEDGGIAPDGGGPLTPPPDASPPPPPPKDGRLFPAELNRTWTFHTQQSFNGQVTNTTIEMRATGKAVVDGRNAWVLTYSTMATPQYVDLQGDDMWIKSGESWVPSLKGPVAEGASWSYSLAGGTHQNVWHKAPKTTVAAGSFDDCWRVDYRVTETSKPGDVNYSVVCRGVGTVLQGMQLSTGFQSRTELVAKSF